MRNKRKLSRIYDCETISWGNSHVISIVLSLLYCVKCYLYPFYCNVLLLFISLAEVGNMFCFVWVRDASYRNRTGHWILWLMNRVSKRQWSLKRTYILNILIIRSESLFTPFRLVWSSFQELLLVKKTRQQWFFEIIEFIND